MTAPPAQRQRLRESVAAVAPSVQQQPSGAAAAAGPVGGVSCGVDGAAANVNFYFPNRAKPSPVPSGTSGARLRANVPPSDSPALKGGASLSSLPVSVAEDPSQRFYWDSYDLNNEEGVTPLPKLSEVPAAAEGDSFVSTSTGSNGRPICSAASNP